MQSSRSLPNVRGNNVVKEYVRKWLAFRVSSDARSMPASVNADLWSENSEWPSSQRTQQIRLDDRCNKGVVNAWIEQLRYVGWGHENLVDDVNDAVRCQDIGSDQSSPNGDFTITELYLVTVDHRRHHSIYHSRGQNRNDMVGRMSASVAFSSGVSKSFRLIPHR